MILISRPFILGLIAVSIFLAAAITVRALTTFRPTFASLALVFGAWAVIHGWWLLRKTAPHSLSARDRGSS